MFGRVVVGWGTSEETTLVMYILFLLQDKDADLKEI
jgi:hypothetical protein